VALKKATTSQLNAERCWYRYLTQLTECAGGKKDCVNRLKALEDVCLSDAVRAVREGRSVLNSRE